MGIVWISTRFGFSCQQLHSAQMARFVNQHSPQLPLHAFVDDLLTARCDSFWLDEEVQIFRCMIPTGRGISMNEGGYKRVSFNGQRVLCHVIVLESHFPRPIAVGGKRYDVSHLCGNNACCNLSHLAWETRDLNLARRGCAGFVHTDGDWVRVCQHQPSCRVTTRGIPVEQPEED